MATSASPETDPRFPSGPWLGFFLQKEIPGRHLMEMQIAFCAGRLKGEGRDWVGPFTLKGHYNLSDGKCRWTKHYIKRHDVFYQGFNEGKGIWGTWELPAGLALEVTPRGGFHIWPKGMPGGPGDSLHEEADMPAVVEGSLAESEALVGGPAGRLD